MDFILEKKQNNDGDWIVRVSINDGLSTFLQYKEEPSDEVIEADRLNYVAGLLDLKWKGPVED